MADSEFSKAVTRAARAVATLQRKRVLFRRQLDQLDQAYRDAQRELRLLVASVEPYTPPAPGEASAAQRTVEQHEC